jgi:hypothetical protein
MHARLFGSRREAGGVPTCSRSAGRQGGSPHAAAVQETQRVPHMQQKCRKTRGSHAAEVQEDGGPHMQQKCTQQSSQPSGRPQLGGSWKRRRRFAREGQLYHAIMFCTATHASQQPPWKVIGGISTKSWPLHCQFCAMSDAIATGSAAQHVRMAATPDSSVVCFEKKGWHKSMHACAGKWCMVVITPPCHRRRRR